MCECGGNFVQTTTMNGHEVEVTHLININDGQPIEYRQPKAIGSTEEVIDRVFIVCQDLEGNCYQTYEYDVPVEHFANGGSRDE